MQRGLGFWTFLPAVVLGGWGESAAGQAVPVERYRAVLELSAGEMDGPLALTRVEHIVVQGPHVFVSQPSEHLIRVLSSESGGLIGELGGPGDGPGELRDLGWMGRTGDTLFVLDHLLRRTTSFDRDGVRATRSLSLPPLQLPYFWTPMAATSEGHLVAVQVFTTRLGGSEEPSTLERWLLLDSEEGVVLDTLPAVDRRDASITLRSERGTTSIARPIHRGDRWSMATDGSRFVVVGDERGEGLRLSVYRTAERRTDVLRPGLPPVAVDRHIADSIMAPLREAILERGMAEGVGRRELEAALAAPEWLPAADEVFVTAAGEIWLREPSFSGPHHLWRILESDGALSAEVEVPFGVVLRDREGDRAWGYRIDPEFGVYTVQRYRLEPVDEGDR